mgnify:FL=1
MENIDKDLFVIMINDWMADNADEMCDLVIGEPYQTAEGKWVADAHDQKCTYLLAADNDGNITIIYIGAL